MSATRELGNRGEALAAEYLERSGYRLLGHNVRIGRYEVDLIARDRRTIVFVEVKTRRGDDFGAPEEAITSAKMGHLERALAVYVQQHPEVRAARVDVIAIRYQASGLPTLRHLKSVGPGALAIFT